MERKVDKTRLHLLAAVGVALGIALVIAIRSFLDGAPPLPRVGPGNVPAAAPGPTVTEVVSRHLVWADEQASAGLAPQLAPIREFFAEARKGTRAFAQDALSFDCKWKFAVDYVTDGDEHRQYLEQRFAARVFAQENLEKTVQYAVQAYLTHLDDVDSALLVNLKADLEGIPSSGFSAGVDRSLIEQSLNAAIEGAMQAVEADFPGMIGRELVSFVAGEVLTAASVQLATSAGILSVGASSGTVTFGVGLVVGVIVDVIVGWAYDRFADPAGELSRKLDGTLTQLEKVIVEGQGDEPGLNRRLSDYAARRGEARNAAVTSVVMP